MSKQVTVTFSECEHGGDLAVAEVPVVSDEELKDLLGKGWISSSEKVPKMGHFWGIIEKEYKEGMLGGKKGDKYRVRGEVYRNDCAKAWQYLSESKDWVNVLYWMPIHQDPDKEGSYIL